MWGVDAKEVGAGYFGAKIGAVHALVAVEDGHGYDAAVGLVVEQTAHNLTPLHQTQTKPQTPFNICIHTPHRVPH